MGTYAEPSRAVVLSAHVAHDRIHEREWRDERGHGLGSEHAHIVNERRPRLWRVERTPAIAVLERLHAAQGAFYAGGDDGLVRELLADDIEWHVPGRNAIAGDYRGVEEVLEYMRRRRDLASKTFRLHPGEVLTGDGEHVAVLTDGTAIIGGAERRWSTVGLYRVGGGRIEACWLLPLDPVAFDEIWAAPR